ncbi:MAG: hypothetical protein QXS29_09735 [Nitrososphaeria archaeon]
MKNLIIINIPAVRLDSQTGITFYKHAAQLLEPYDFYTLDYDPDEKKLYLYPLTKEKIGAFKFSKVDYTLRGTTTIWKRYGIQDGIYPFVLESEKQRFYIDLNQKICELEDLS